MITYKTAGLLPILCLVGNTAVAEGFYLGAKAGVMKPGISELDDATNIGGVIGYEIGEASDNLTWIVEAEFTTTASDGDVEVLGLSGDWDVDTQALYAGVRVGTDLYAKLRLGYLRKDVSVSIAGFSADGSDTGASAGIGGGWRLNESVGLEVEYTFIEEDLDFYSFGVNFSF